MGCAFSMMMGKVRVNFAIPHQNFGAAMAVDLGRGAKVGKNKASQILASKNHGFGHELFSCLKRK
tara:strand:- start:255 stop:449 length:195 start_codon:yes stop_codon:yes gene_type:complete